MAEIDDKINALKEELLREIRLTENRSSIAKQEFEKEIEAKIDLINLKDNEIKVRLDDLQDFNATVKVKVLDNMEEFAKFKTNTAEDLFMQNILVAKMDKDLSNITNRFDKMFIENLLIPGKIGDFCQYKNLKDYIEVNI